MKYIDVVGDPIRVCVETEKGLVSLPDKDAGDVAVELAREGGRLKVYVAADQTPVCRVWLIWEARETRGARVLGDAWERGYGDLEWRGVAPDRVMPWYVLCADENGTCGYGVETGAAAMCSWRLDGHHLRLCLDVRNGGSGVVLGGRRLLAATVLSRPAQPDETPYQAAKALCRAMCPAPRLPREPVYGGNNWYYAYGNSSHERIMEDARLMADLCGDAAARPFMVIDDGWQLCHNDSCNGGPWTAGNYRFPDMAKLARDMKAAGVRPGIWFRPLSTSECFPEECYRGDVTGGKERTLDPSHPFVLEWAEKTVRQLADWGYELIKHDFSTYDIFGRWGFQMGGELTRPGWHFFDRSRTTAEIILDLYRALRRGAGDRTLLLGCNTVSHLAAGIFEIMRTGDDTSGVEWARTRKMGVNTLAFRMPQNGTFYASDADCAGITGKIDWELNRQWIGLLAVSGTPLFLSVDPEAVTGEQKEYLREAIQTWLSVKREAVPLDWMDTACPEEWDTDKGRMTFSFPEDF